MSGGNEGSSRSEKVFSWLFAGILLVSIVGFITGVLFLVVGRFGLMRQLAALVSTSRWDDVTVLLEKFNALTSTDTLSLFYTVITTIIFSLGIKLYADMKAEAKGYETKVSDMEDKLKKSAAEAEGYETKVSDLASQIAASETNLREVQRNVLNLSDEAFISAISTKVSTPYILSLTVDLAVDKVEKSTRIRTIYEHLSECERQFKVSDIRKVGSIQHVRMTDLRSVFTVTKNKLSAQERKFARIPDNLIEVADHTDMHTIKDCIKICDKYLSCFEETMAQT